MIILFLRGVHRTHSHPVTGILNFQTMQTYVLSDLGVNLVFGQFHLHGNLLTATVEYL